MCLICIAVLKTGVLSFSVIDTPDLNTAVTDVSQKRSCLVTIETDGYHVTINLPSRKTRVLEPFRWFPYYFAVQRNQVCVPLNHTVECCDYIQRLLWMNE